MMKSDKIQRTLMGIMLSVVLYLFNTQHVMLANYLLVFIIAMIVIWAFFDFCPSLWTLRKVFKEECSKC